MNHIKQILNFTDTTLDEFLDNAWQKKPVVLKQAMPNFVNELSPEELAGLSLEPDIESRIVVESPNQPPYWSLLTGPFDSKTFENLPKTHWTLLVQGVDRLLPEIQQLLNYFDFIPQWRVDDIMISYAAKHGSVGPHYDNYDVFLLQAQGRRKWMLTTKHCNNDNYLPDTELRIMNQFITEQTYVLEPGDVLYLPPHVGHHGISLTDDCMTYSFGYRSYQGKELLNSFCDYVSDNNSIKTLYKDPDWRVINQTSELPDSAWKSAQTLLKNALSDDEILAEWFSQFATQLDSETEAQLPTILEDVCEADFITQLKSSNTLQRHPACKILYRAADHHMKLYINGVPWKIDGTDNELIKIIANQRTISSQNLTKFLNSKANILFLFELWQLQWLQFEQEYAVH